MGQHHDFEAQLLGSSMDDIRHHFIRVEFHRFKVFRNFTVNLRSFNILVGPNNAGKSTILAAFRILASAMRKATSLTVSVST